MTTATASPKLAPAPAAKRGFSLTCLSCGQQASITLDLDDCHTFHCPDCENEFTADDVRQVIGEWQRVLSWLDLAPPAADD